MNRRAIPFKTVEFNDQCEAPFIIFIFSSIHSSNGPIPTTTTTIITTTTTTIITTTKIIAD
jgi:hypothetical protein